MPERTTLKDVAREAGVHISTASRALNPTKSGVVSPSTVLRVQEAAKRLNYRAHPVARGLRTNRTLTIGVVIPDLENPLFGPLIAGSQTELAGHGYSVVIGNAEQNGLDTRKVVNDLLDHKVDGVIIASAARSDTWLSGLVERGVAIVLVNRILDDLSLPAVVCDDVTGIGLAVKHLYALGHRRIGHVAGPSSVSTGAIRRDAFRLWMTKLDLLSQRDQVEEANWFQADAGQEAAVRLMEKWNGITALVAANDLIALGCYRAVNHMRKRVGIDISVTGYNDIPLLALMQPPLTTVRVPYRDMGRRAALLMLEQLSSPQERSPSRLEFLPSMVLRESTSAPTTD
ncbi:MAG TPA: LacI family DNA-binding transcriptional regulator [Rhodothermales bacterium]|nr:LacI family DNA-binding transcriptional regulator [Rhodothermales bacterium]